MDEYRVCKVSVTTQQIQSWNERWVGEVGKTHNDPHDMVAIRSDGDVSVRSFRSIMVSYACWTDRVVGP